MTSWVCRRAGWYSYDGLDNGGSPSAPATSFPSCSTSTSETSAHGRGGRADDALTVAPDADLPADAVAVLVDLELDLEPAVVGLGLELGGGAVHAATSPRNAS